MESWNFSRLVEIVDGVISATCPGGKRLRGANSAFATGALVALIWFCFLKDDSVYDQWKHMVNDVRDLAITMREDHSSVLGLADQVARTNGRVTLVEDKVSDLNIKVQVLDQTAIKKTR